MPHSVLLEIFTGLAAGTEVVFCETPFMKEIVPQVQAIVRNEAA